MSQFHEPWRMVGITVQDSEQGPFGRGTTIHGSGHEFDAQTLTRIVACVNFCAGVPTERLTDAVTLDRFLATMRAGEKIVRSKEEVEKEYGMPPGYLTRTVPDCSPDAEIPEGWMP